jgi:hypothetical protein
MVIKKITNQLSRSSLERSEQGQRGVAMVEFAIILPLLLVLTFGIIEFGLVLYNKQVITNASREGARAGIVAADPRYDATYIESVVDTYVADNLVTFGADKDPDVYVNGYSSNPSLGDELKVDVEFDYQFLVLPPLLSLLSAVSDDFSGWSPLTLRASTLMRYE